ncbi:MAG: GNAT family N-acetyltransferase [Verrucomicrobiales bacterium]
MSATIEELPTFFGNRSLRSRMEKSWSIRAARIGEAGLILQMIRSLAEYEKLQHDVIATEEDIDRTILAQNSPVKCLLGFVGEQPAGFAVYFYNYSTFQGKYGIYLEDIFVRPEFRGLGLGRGLLQEIMNQAKVEQCGRVEWVALDWNTPAIEFYEKMGAKALREWIRFRLTMR